MLSVVVAITLLPARKDQQKLSVRVREDDHRPSASRQFSWGMFSCYFNRSRTTTDLGSTR